MCEWVGLSKSEPVLSSGFLTCRESSLLPPSLLPSLHPRRAGGKVRHCRIQVEGGQFQIGSASFDSLTELVQYYESNPLYRRMKLKYAINDDVLKSIGEVSVGVWSNFDPQNPSL